MTVDESIRLLDRNPNYSAELDNDGTTIAIKKATNP